MHHHTPKECLLEHLGFGNKSDTQDELDERTNALKPKNTRISCTNSKNTIQLRPHQMTTPVLVHPIYNNTNLLARPKIPG